MAKDAHAHRTSPLPRRRLDGEETPTCDFHIPPRWGTSSQTPPTPERSALMEAFHHEHGGLGFALQERRMRPRKHKAPRAGHPGKPGETRRPDLETLYASGPTLAIGPDPGNLTRSAGTRPGPSIATDQGSHSSNQSRTMTQGSTTRTQHARQHASGTATPPGFPR